MSNADWIPLLATLRLTLSQPPHILCHFGMAGWFHIKGQSTSYAKSKTYAKPIPDEELWPPKYWKFALTTSSSPPVEAAFVDFRRFGRVRLVDCAAADIRSVSPLKENGPDPVVDKETVTEAWLGDLCKAKKVPIKALLLDQGNISGIGNWVGDELLYHARIHPEQYCNTLNEAQVRQLHESLHYVCGLACELLADSNRFPEEWLFKHRWGKGKKDSVDKLPNGEKIVYLTVGGRTSAVVPSVQKKTGPVAGDVKGEGDGGGKVKGKGQKGGGRKRKRKAKEEEDEESDDEAEEKSEEVEEEQKPSRRGRKSNPRLPATSPKPTTNGANNTAKRSIIKRQAETNGPASPQKARKGRGKVSSTAKEAEEPVEAQTSVKQKKPNRGLTKKQKLDTDVDIDDRDGDIERIDAEDENGKEKSKAKEQRKAEPAKKVKEPPLAEQPETGRRRSGRLSGR